MVSSFEDLLRASGKSLDAEPASVRDAAPAARLASRTAAADTLRALSAAARRVSASSGADSVERAVRDAMSQGRELSADPALLSLRALASRMVDPGRGTPSDRSAQKATRSGSGAPQLEPPPLVALRPAPPQPAEERALSSRLLSRSTIGETTWAGGLSAAEERILQRVRDEYTDLNGLSAYVSAKSRPEKVAAEPLYKRAVEDARKRLGPRKSDTLAFIVGHAALLQARCTATLPWRSRLLLSLSLGALSLSRALHLQELGQLEQAEALFKEGVEGIAAVRGGMHPDTLVALMQLAGCLAARGKLREALPACREALRLARELLGDVNATTLRAINQLALLQLAAGEMGEAERLMRDAARIRSQLLAAPQAYRLG